MSSTRRGKAQSSMLSARPNSCWTFSTEGSAARRWPSIFVSLFMVLPLSACSRQADLYLLGLSIYTVKRTPSSLSLTRFRSSLAMTEVSLPTLTNHLQNILHRGRHNRESQALTSYS